MEEFTLKRGFKMKEIKQELSLNKTDLDFLSNHWNKLQGIKQRILRELPSFEFIPQLETGGRLFFVKFSDLKNSWSPSDILRSMGKGEKSVALKSLAGKLAYMIDKGRSNDIQHVLRCIVENKVKGFNQPCSKEYKKESGTLHGGGDTNAIFLGYGHFRWDFKVWTLTPQEIARVKEFFNL